MIVARSPAPHAPSPAASYCRARAASAATRARLVLDERPHRQHRRPAGRRAAAAGQAGATTITVVRDGSSARQPQELRELDVVGDDHDLDARVVEDELGLRGGQRRIDGNVDRPGRQDGQVGDRPFRAAFADEADAVAGLDAQAGGVRG